MEIFVLPRAITSALSDTGIFTVRVIVHISSIRGKNAGGEKKGQNQEKGQNFIFHSVPSEELKLLCLYCFSGNSDLKIAVSGAKHIDKFLFLTCVTESEIIGKAEHTAHISGPYLYKLTVGGVLCKEVVKNRGIVKILGNGYAKGLA